MRRPTVLPHLPVPRPRPAGLVALLATAVLGTGITAAATSSPDAQPSAAPAAAAPAAPPAEAAPAPSAAPAARVPAGLPPLAGRQRADVAVSAPAPLPADTVARLVALAPPAGAVAVRTGPVVVADQELPVVAVDPAAFRTFAAEGTAEADAVWQAVARGEAVVSHAAADRLHLVLGGTVPVAARGGVPVLLRVGALATTGLPGTDLVVDDQVGTALGLPLANEVLLAAGTGDAVALAGAARQLAGTADVDLLTEPVTPTAFLTGSKAAKAFGAFSYRYYPDGTIEPDAGWVKKNIASQDVPLLGRVTCHRLVLPQLRGALAEIEARGLGGSLHTYDGCYVPRFIERNPDRPVSLHTWGIAIDLDAATNHRGIRGTMDPAVVEVFKRWGFRWGGDWAYTDPMHFELGAVLDQPPAKK